MAARDFRLEKLGGAATLFHAGRCQGQGGDGPAVGRADRPAVLAPPSIWM